ncbi:MAG: TRAP transporter small permease [Erythrobacter sp.]|uniref:TRAP transporter small permease n=1 Tax=Erythrobacter sp. TaxID=1042 RepID=UPI00262C945D|nr:TRAP transporter small permease [Erythrobacter sp.]MDJ0978189.1 TRAP transporter small permease [Erythrobacter sp.]
MTRWLSMALIRLAALGLVAMTAIIGWQVFGRFVLDSSPSWTEQAALALMIWYVMLAAAAGVYERFHIRIALLEGRLGERATILRRVVAAITLFLGVMLAIYGTQLCWAVRGNTIPSLGLSRAVAYFPLPLAGLLMAWFALPQTWQAKSPESAGD